MPQRFLDRSDAGRQLAERVQSLDLHDPVVLALPRGGVPVGVEVAKALDATLDVFVARKVGAPGHREYGIGAIAESGGEVTNEDALRQLRVSTDRWSELVATERVELDRRVRLYRGVRALPDVRVHDVVLVDDGLATGVTAEAAVRALRLLGAHRIVLAAPACAPDTMNRLAAIADDVVCVISPDSFQAVGQWYERFDQTTDEEVVRLLELSAHR